jgi:hypothetical protein
MASRPDDDSDDPRWVPAVDLVRRTGAREFQIRYCEEEEPVVWLALAMHLTRDGRPVAEDGKETWSVGSGFTPSAALFALCDSLLDGGTCQHCGRPTGFIPDNERQVDEELGAPFVCWYRWDPELRTFRRKCEGE